MPNRTLVEAINDALAVALAADDRVLVLGEDVGRNGGVFRATDGLMERFGAERVVDTPLAEAGIIGTSVGLAEYGMRPVAEIQFLGFTYQACAQLMAQAARVRWRSNGRWPRIRCWNASASSARSRAKRAGGFLRTAWMRASPRPPRS